MVYYHLYNADLYEIGSFFGGIIYMDDGADGDTCQYTVTNIHNTGLTVV